MAVAGKRLSDKQRRMLEFIGQYLEEHGFPPSVRDIQRGCDISSTSVVDYNLHILQREGYIRRSPDISRGIELLGVPGAGRRREPELVMVPVLGAIAAGEPLPVFAESFAQEPMETLELPQAMVGGTGQVYALKVKGHSMIDALVDDGDLVLVEPTGQARDGEMAAVWLRDEREATLKRFYREGERVRLQPANAQMAPIYAEARNVEVQGRVVGVWRAVR